MLFEHLARDALVVLAADSQDNAPVPQAFDITLKAKKRFAFGFSLSEADPAQAVIPNNSSPEGVVQIEHETFFAQARLCGDQRSDTMSVIDQKLGSARNFCMMEKALITPMPAPVSGGERVHIMQGDV